MTLGRTFKQTEPALNLLSYKSKPFTLKKKIEQNDGAEKSDHSLTTVRSGLDLKSKISLLVKSHESRQFGLYDKIKPELRPIYKFNNSRNSLADTDTVTSPHRIVVQSFTRDNINIKLHKSR